MFLSTGSNLCSACIHVLSQNSDITRYDPFQYAVLQQHKATQAANACSELNYPNLPRLNISYCVVHYPVNVKRNNAASINFIDVHCRSIRAN